MPASDEQPAPRLRPTTVADGAAIWRLVQQAGVLDLNSSYMYLLMCDRFGDSCVIAETRTPDQPAGFVVGFVPPQATDVVFVWQIGVAPDWRGQGLGRAMLRALVDSKADAGVNYLETTVTPSNEASVAMFRSFARSVEAPMEAVSARSYSTDLFPDGKETEVLYRIGPFSSSRED